MTSTRTTRESGGGPYDVESYWSRVAGQIAARALGNVVAGDDDAFWRYKRRKFLGTFLHTIDFGSASVLEVGCGPGGNLLEIARRHSPDKLMAVDISQAMIEIATGNLARHSVAAELYKIDGAHLPFADRSIDLSYTVTVLQHNTDSAAFEALCRELCRVTSQRIILMEDTGNNAMTASRSFIARSVGTYESAFAGNGFALTERQRLNIRASSLAHAVVHRLLVSKDRQEGDPIGVVPQTMLAAVLPLARVLDPLFVESAGLTKMTFQRATAQMQ